MSAAMRWLPALRTGLPDAALAYAAAGWPVFPTALDKRPLTPHGLHDGTAETDQIRSWWRRWPQAGIGWPIPHGHVVLDVDPRHGGVESLASLEEQHGRLPPTLQAETGGGGQHLVFRLPETVEARQLAGFRPGLDTRAAGRGYIVLAPSMHPSGRRYTWTSTLEPAVAPEWLVEVIRVRPVQAASTYTPAPCSPFASGRRMRYAAAVLAGEARAVAETGEGARNARLFRAWKRCAEFKDVIAREDAERALTAAAIAAGLPEPEIRKVLR
jgi:hypothetical protein